MKTLITAWVTKYALTKGISKEEGLERFGDNLTRRRYGKTPALFVTLGQDAFLTEEEAKAKALVMAKNAIKALERKRKKLEDLVSTLEDNWEGKLNALREQHQKEKRDAKVETWYNPMPISRGNPPTRPKYRPRYRCC